MLNQNFIEKEENFYVKSDSRRTAVVLFFLTLISALPFSSDFALVENKNILHIVLFFRTINVLINLITGILLFRNRSVNFFKYVMYPVIAFSVFFLPLLMFSRPANYIYGSMFTPVLVMVFYFSLPLSLVFKAACGILICLFEMAIIFYLKDVTTPVKLAVLITYSSTNVVGIAFSALHYKIRREAFLARYRAETELEYQRIFAMAMPVAIVLHYKGILRLVNYYFSNLMTTSLDKFVDKSLFDFVDPADHPALTKTIFGANATDECQCRLIHPDGRLISVEIQKGTHSTELPELELLIIREKSVEDNSQQSVSDILSLLPSMIMHNVPAFVKNYKLSSRESQIAIALVEGKSGAEISKQFFISENTVKKHISNLYTKGGVSGRNEFVRKVATMTE